MVRTTKSPASISSVNDSPGTISTMRKRTGSSPGGVMVKVVPTANGPSISIFSMPSFQLGHVAISDQRRHSASRVAVVSRLCSYSHMIPPGQLNFSLGVLALPRQFRQADACILLRAAGQRPAVLATLMTTLPGSRRARGARKASGRALSSKTAETIGAHLLLVDKNGQLAQLAGVWP